MAGLSKVNQANEGTGFRGRLTGTGSFDVIVFQALYGSTYADLPANIRPAIAYSVNPATGNVDQVAVWKDGWWVANLTPEATVADVTTQYAAAIQVDRDIWDAGWVPAT
jgi:hypothetical protein